MREREWVSQIAKLRDQSDNVRTGSEMDRDRAGHAFLVTGDQDLLGLRDDLPILTPAEFVTKLREQP